MVPARRLNFGENGGRREGQPYPEAEYGLIAKLGCDWRRGSVEGGEKPEPNDLEARRGDKSSRRIVLLFGKGAAEDGTHCRRTEHREEMDAGHEAGVAVHNLKTFGERDDQGEVGVSGEKHRPMREGRWID